MLGITNDLVRRTYEHKNGLVSGFTDKYDVKNLVYYQETNDIGVAIQREKSLKHWSRDWKIDLINEFNPKWEDLSEKIFV